MQTVYNLGCWVLGAGTIQPDLAGASRCSVLYGKFGVFNAGGRCGFNVEAGGRGRFIGGPPSKPQFLRANWSGYICCKPAEVSYVGDGSKETLKRALPLAYAYCKGGTRRPLAQGVARLRVGKGRRSVFPGPKNSKRALLSARTYCKGGTRGPLA